MRNPRRKYENNGDTNVYDKSIKNMEDVNNRVNSVQSISVEAIWANIKVNTYEYERDRENYGTMFLGNDFIKWKTNCGAHRVFHSRSAPAIFFYFNNAVSEKNCF